MGMGNNSKKQFFIREHTISEDEQYEKRHHAEEALQEFLEEKEQLIFDTTKLNLRSLIYTILCVHPELTQRDIAEKLGCTAVTFSRMLQNPDNTVKPEWVPVVQQLLLDSDLHTFLQETKKIEDHKARLQIDLRREKISEVLYEHYGFSRQKDSDEFYGVYHSMFGHAGGLCFTDISCTNYWYFWDYDSARKETKTDGFENPFKLLDVVSRGSDYIRTTVFTTEVQIFDELVQKYIVSDEQGLFSEQNHYRSIMYIDYQRKRVMNEYVVSQGPN